MQILGKAIGFLNTGLCNLNLLVEITESGVQKTYGFAKYLHDSLPNATYVGFTGTPVDGTIEVFGGVVDAYTMTEAARPS